MLDTFDKQQHIQRMHDTQPRPALFILRARHLSSRRVSGVHLSLQVAR
jgi:hypothetical protein